jgi:hypothetical protein
MASVLVECEVGYCRRYGLVAGYARRTEAPCAPAYVLLGYGIFHDTAYAAGTVTLGRRR